MRKETEIILKDNFNYQEIILLNELANIYRSKIRNTIYHEKIWKYDQSLKGLGGYACPLNVIVNPFNQFNEYRNVFRSLQYARSDMYIGSRARFVITDSGLHIESLIKILVSKNSKLKFIKNTRMLGKNISFLSDKNILEYKLCYKIKHLTNLYNLAKHDTDHKNNITFDYDDGIIFDFAGRKIGNELLKILDHHTYNKSYKISFK